MKHYAAGHSTPLFPYPSWKQDKEEKPLVSRGDKRELVTCKKLLVRRLVWPCPALITAVCPVFSLNPISYSSAGGSVCLYLESCVPTTRERTMSYCRGAPVPPGPNPFPLTACICQIFLLDEHFLWTMPLT